jgi:4-diphosphocytidyl-2-C-methyl-D-erythritol kinase
LWGGRLKQQDLAEIGLRLGADVPLFVFGHSAWAEGVGDLLTPLELPERWFLVIVPDCHVSTGKIFQHQQLTRDSSPLKIARFLEQGAFFPDQNAPTMTGNDCESLVRTLYPAIDEALNWLSQWGPARMTGTGASVFSTFDSEAEAAQVFDQVPDRWRGIITRGVNTSPLLIAEAEINDSIT